MHSLLFKYFKIFCLAYKMEEQYGEKKFNLLFLRMIKHSPSVSCDRYYCQNMFSENNDNRK